MQKKIYIAGKVSGLAIQDLEAKFNTVEETLTEQGYTVANPIKIVMEGTEWEPAMARCIQELVSCQEIFMLHDWKQSPGARMEHDIAKKLKLRIHYGIAPKVAAFNASVAVAMLIVISMASCSQRWYAKQCERRFPVTENIHESVKYSEGKTDTLMQSVTIDCDSVIKYSHDTVHSSHIVKAPCPPSLYRVDTFSNTITIVRKDSAGNFLTQSELTKLRQRTADQADKISRQARIIRKFTIGLVLAGLLGIVVLVLKSYKRKFL